MATRLPSHLQRRQLRMPRANSPGGNQSLCRVMYVIVVTRTILSPRLDTAAAAPGPGPPIVDGDRADHPVVDVMDLISDVARLLGTAITDEGATTIASAAPRAAMDKATAHPTICPKSTSGLNSTGACLRATSRFSVERFS
jgi:hypothetical protein